MRKYLYLLVIMGLSSLALAQNVRQDNIAFSRSGFPAPGALVAVCLQPATAGSTSLTACAPLAPLCSSSTDAICSSPNPVTADGLGNYHFYVKPGTYAIQIYGSGLTLSLLRDQTVGGSSGGSAGAATTEVLANCTATGTILNEGVELSSQVISGALTACGTVASASSTSVIGICSSGCGITGSAQIAYQAFQSAIFDNQTVIGDVAAPSSSPGQFTDIGSLRVPGVESVGRIASINSGTGTAATINMFTGDMTASGASNGSGNVSQCNTSGGVSFYSAIGTIVVCDPSATLDGNGKLTAKQVVVAGTGPGTVTLQTGTAPANPATGNGLLYVDSGTGFLSCLNSAGGSCNPLTASLAFSALTSGTNTAAAMIVGSGASLKPLNLGQVAGSQAWLALQSLPDPALASSTTGGSILNGHTIKVKYTLVSAAGETIPSNEVGIQVSGACSGGNQCSVTVTAPTIPSGFTGYTVYSTDGGVAGSELKQIVSNNCVNISTNCVIQAGGTGATFPATTTAYLQPPNLQTSLCPANFLPSLFQMRGDGNFYTLAGIDTSTNSVVPTPQGTFTYCTRVFFNDTTSPISGSVLATANTGVIRNALVSIAHQVGTGTGTGSTTDDRALAIRQQTVGSSAVTLEQNLAIYLENVLDNPAFSCNNSGPGVGEDCYAGARFTTSDQRVTPTGVMTGNVGVHGVAGINSNSTGLYGGCSLCVVGVLGTAGEGTVTAHNIGGAFIAGVAGGFNGSAGNANGSGAALWAMYPSIRMATQNIGLNIVNGYTSAQANDYAIRSEATAHSKFQGSLNLGFSNAILANAVQSLGIVGSPVVLGSVNTTQFGTPSTPSVNNIGAAGGTSYSYVFCVQDGNGKQACSATATTATGNATLTGSNFNRIGIGNTVADSLPGASLLVVYRTASGGTPSSTGKIACTGITSLTDLLAVAIGANFNCDDTGLAGDGSSPPTSNQTGSIVAAGPIVQTASGPVSGSWNCINVTPVTVNTNTAADQNMMACTVPANTLNVVNKTLRVYAAGVYSTPAGSTSQMTMKAKLCAVSGCGSGTVITPISIQSTALGTIQVTNDNFSLHSDVTTQTAGATSAYEAHGEFLIDLAALTTAADSSFGDTNTATVGTIDATAQLFLQMTFAFSNASGSNSATQRQLIVDTVN